jgi:hypothetical protein
VGCDDIHDMLFCCSTYVNFCITYRSMNVLIDSIKIVRFHFHPFYLNCVYVMGLNSRIMSLIFFLKKIDPKFACFFMLDFT